MNPKMQESGPSTHPPYVIDNSDWLKTGAICLVAVGHIGYFFIDDAGWWSVFGRMAAPVFFFLMGYARSRNIPLLWIWLCIILTLLDSWNNDWTWVAPNILFSMVLIRLARPRVKIFLQNHGWIAFALLVSVLFAVLPIAAEIVDYGAEGWLWALFGVCQRVYVDDKTRSRTLPVRAMTGNPNLMRFLACFIAAVIYVWQEQLEFLFTRVQLNAVILGVSFLSIALFLFQRGQSRFQPPEPIAGALHFLGRHTLEIYVIQLAGSELLIGFLPDLAP